MTPHRTDRRDPFARQLIVGGGIQPRRSPMRDDLAAVKGMLVGLGLGAVLWVTGIWLVIR